MGSSSSSSSHNNKDVRNYDNDNDDYDSNSNDPPESVEIHNDEIKKQQIVNYRNGTGLMINVHMTHHGGTTFCGTIGRNGINGGIAPAFACGGDKDGVMPESLQDNLHKEKKPWSYDHTEKFIRYIRPYFHMVSWEFGGPPKRPISETNWEHPELCSVIITRDPISRLLAGDGITSKKYPGFSNGTLSHDKWWEFAIDDKNTDNFFLRLLGGQKYKKNPNFVHTNRRNLRENKNENYNNNVTTTITLNGTENDSNNDEIFVPPPLYNPLYKKDYDHGVELLHRFTYVLDIQCLNEGMMELANQLNLNIKNMNATIQSNTKTHKATKHSTSSLERIGFEDVYEYLVEKNKWDIELYEYSKSISLVKCSDISDNYTGRY